MTNSLAPTGLLGRAGNEVAVREYAGSPSLETVRSKGRLLKDGQAGQAVREAQQLIADAGVEIVVDAKYGPNTVAAVRTFQRANGLPVDGIVGPQTLGALEELAAQRAATDRARRDMGTDQRVTSPQRRTIPGLTPLPPAPGQPGALPSPTSGRTRSVPGLTPLPGRTPATEPTRIPETPAPVVPGSTFAPEPGRVNSAFATDRSGREHQAEDILRANDQWPPQEGRLYVVQIDQDSPPANAPRSDRSSYLHSYTGQTVVFKAEGDRLVEQNPSGPLRSASHPGQFTSRAGTFTSVDNDNIPDIAHLRGGAYEYRGRPNGSGRFNPVSHQAMKVARDINHNGVIDGANENNPDFYATYLQLHSGGDNSPSSVGCQTMPPSDYRELSEALAPARSGTFTYVLVRRPNDTHGASPF